MTARTRLGPATVAILLFLQPALGLAALSPAALTLPAGEWTFADDFDDDPRESADWTLTSGWLHRSVTNRLNASRLKKCTATWTGQMAVGVIETRVRLFRNPDGRPASGGIVFATGDGGFRHVTLISGSAGKVILGQVGAVGDIAEPWKKRVTRSVPAGFHTLRVEVGESSVSVFFDGEPVTGIQDYPLAAAAGGAGIRARRTKASFEYLALSDGEKPTELVCGVCHNASPPSEERLAPDVTRYWDGSWWDSTLGGDSSTQQGGHGDPDNEKAATCVGTTGCHDLETAMAREKHRDGVLQGKGKATANTYHLRSEFIKTNPSTPWDVQVTFDNFCFTACHQAVGQSDMRHDKDQNPVQYAAQLGTHLSLDRGEAVPYPVDEDLTTLVDPGQPDFVTCVSCHDPHGTGVKDVKGSTSSRSNRMLRDFWYSRSTLCKNCHT